MVRIKGCYMMVLLGAPSQLDRLDLEQTRNNLRKFGEDGDFSVPRIKEERAFGRLQLSGTITEVEGVLEAINSVRDLFSSLPKGVSGSFFLIDPTGSITKLKAGPNPDQLFVETSINSTHIVPKPFAIPREGSKKIEPKEDLGKLFEIELEKAKIEPLPKEAPAEKGLKTKVARIPEENKEYFEEALKILERAIKVEYHPDRYDPQVHSRLTSWREGLKKAHGDITEFVKVLPPSPEVLPIGKIDKRKKKDVVVSRFSKDFKENRVEPEPEPDANLMDDGRPFTINERCRFSGRIEQKSYNKRTNSYMSEGEWMDWEEKFGHLYPED